MSTNNGNINIVDTIHYLAHTYLNSSGGYMSEKTCYTYKQVKVPVKAHELAQEIAKQKGERLADTWINALQDYKAKDNE